MGQRPQRCAVGLAWLPTLKEDKLRLKLIPGLLNAFPFSDSGEVRITAKLGGKS